MAHVLLPCDLPSWPDVLQLLQRLQNCPSGHQLAITMTSILEICSVSLDPDGQDVAPADLGALGRFVDCVLPARERSRLLGRTLPAMAERAARLGSLRPARGLLYSLKGEDGSVELERPFVASLLANAFFSTFPKKSAKTHPTLQDFRMEHFFQHLDKRGHQKKMSAFFRYFEGLECTPGARMRVTRKALPGPSLPAWLCSDRPLVPLLLRTDGHAHQAEPHLYRIYPCSPLIGGDVFKTSTSKEARLLFAFPELLAVLSFAEGLGAEEAVIAEGTHGGPAGFCLTSHLLHSAPPYEDRFLLEELNKTLAAFSHRSYSSCRLEEEEEASLPSRSVSCRRSLTPEELPPMELRKIISRTHGHDLQRRRSSQASSRLSLRTASQGSPVRDDDYVTADEDSDGASPARGDATSEESSLSRRSSSEGHVLGESSSHERLEDFRRRIRKRCRRRKSSRRTSGGGSSSSDMGDISEEEEEPHPPSHVTIRSAHSEPNLLLPAQNTAGGPPPALVHDRGRLVATSSGGQLKSYSYDGVHPNLPVPFRARFRRRRSERDRSGEGRLTPNELIRRVGVAADADWWGDVQEDPQLRAALLWLAASMAELQALVLYTAHAREVLLVQRSAESRDWTVGDLSCEVLRFCRNRLRPDGAGRPPLFAQILGPPS